MAATEMTFSAIGFESAGDAIQWANASGQGEAVMLDGQCFVIEPAELQRVALAGIDFAYLCDHEMPDGSRRIMTVPVGQ